MAYHGVQVPDVTGGICDECENLGRFLNWQGGRKLCTSCAGIDSNRETATE